MDKLNRFFTTFYKTKRKVLNTFERSLFWRRYSTIQTRPKLNILFFGNDKFSLASLRLLNNAKHQIPTIGNVDIVTSFKSPANEVKKFADQQNLTSYKWPISPDVILQQQYDLGIVVSFGHLIPENIIKAFPLGMINVHASLLPRWRGAAPIIYAIMNGDTITGVSVMKIVPKYFDIGDVLAQRSIHIPPYVLMPELHTRLADLGAEALVDCVRDMPQSLHEAQPQSNENISYAPKLQPNITKVDWQCMSASAICNRFRALYTFKCLITTFGKLEVKIHEIELNDAILNQGKNVPQETTTPPGFVEYVKAVKRLKVHCIGGDCIFISKLGVKGKPVMTASEFSCGLLQKVSVTQRYFI